MSAAGVRAVHVLPLALTGVTGAVDATGSLRLGDVFTSVMTDNMVLLGLAAGTADVVLALHIGVAFAGYVSGVLLGSLSSPPSGALDGWTDGPRAGCWRSPVERRSPHCCSRCRRRQRRCCRWYYSCRCLSPP